MQRLQFLCTRVEFLCGEIAVLKFRGILPEKVVQREEELEKWMADVYSNPDCLIQDEVCIPECVIKEYLKYIKRRMV
jgi:hypothetical protein